MTPEESFLKTYEGTLKLHKLDREGKLGSQEADDIRDDLDPHWYNMTEDQQDNIRNISERIYQITSSYNVLVTYLYSESPNNYQLNGDAMYTFKITVNNGAELAWILQNQHGLTEYFGNEIYEKIVYQSYNSLRDKIQNAPITSYCPLIIS